jgi:hypothetical protein
LPKTRSDGPDGIPNSPISRLLSSRAPGPMSTARW